MVSELLAVQRQTRIAVPGALFTAARVPPFPIHGEDDRRINLRERIGEAPEPTVYISPFATGLRFFLEAQLADILGDVEVGSSDRAWAAHRALQFLVGDILHTGRTGIDVRAALATLRLVARFVLEVGAAPVLAQLGPQPSPAGHAVSTAVYSLALAATDGRADLDWLAAVGLAGLTADLGKVDFANAVDHSGALTLDQWATIRRHPQRSLEILREGRGVTPAPTLRGILGHHERWDGSGYPGELIAEAIPYEARVVGIADAFTAITADRPHRPGADLFEALTAMTSTPGLFDPRLMRGFILLLGTQAGDEPPAATSMPASASMERTSA
ncbi:MAG: HD domain-containing phosphohydrolase [Dehalococcoidia bacterium]